MFTITDEFLQDFSHVVHLLIGGQYLRGFGVASCGGVVVVVDLIAARGGGRGGGRGILLLNATFAFPSRSSRSGTVT